MLDGKSILITGGTGTIGSALVKHILNNYDVNVIRILSRDETKQHLLKNQLLDPNNKLRFFIGDIRDKERLHRAMREVDVVFHLAALKHVSACEYNPFEAIKTNVIGVQNIIDIAIERNTEKIIFTSTDKAATPSNTMGVTKLMGEKLITSANYYKGWTKPKFYSVRFGNVVGSRGSLIPLIEEQIKNDQPITLTHSEMTRYIMSLDSAVDFIIKSLNIAQGGEVLVKKMDSIKIIDLIEVLIEFFANKYDKKVDSININEIGMFAGEKLYEELFSVEEAERTYEMEDLYVITPQIREVISKIDLKKYANLHKFDISQPFNSKSVQCLSKEQIKEFLVNNHLI
jgi:FlaA1/EpsC-like NDP-sugar epimerase